MTEPIFHFHYFNSFFFSFLINYFPFIINYQYLICTISILLGLWYFKQNFLLSTKTFRWHRNGNKMSLLQYLAEWSYVQYSVHRSGLQNVMRGYWTVDTWTCCACTFRAWEFCRRWSQKQNKHFKLIQIINSQCFINMWCYCSCWFLYLPNILLRLRRRRRRMFIWRPFSNTSGPILILLPPGNE
jgi:hypothetical protein